jgi:hypothetical protein
MGNKFNPMDIHKKISGIPFKLYKVALNIIGIPLILPGIPFAIIYCNIR